MNLFVTSFPTFVAQSCWIGGLICLLGILRWMAKGRIPQQIFFVGWIIVALALLCPVSIPAGWMPSVTSRLPSLSRHESPVSAQRATAPGISALGSNTALPIPMQNGLLRPGHGVSAAALIWLLGAVTLLTIRATLSYQFHRELGHSAARTNPRYESAVLECAETLQVKTRVAVFVSDAATGPAIGGLWRPYILIPSSLDGRLSEEELRLVILHELGHWRRRDNVVNLLMQCALIVHWFNPVAWLFARMARSDCELACDEFVLGRMTADPLAYGATLLKVLATVRPRTTSPVLLGILGSKQQLKRRFEMIARFKTVSVARLLAGWSVIGVVAVVAATGKLNASGTPSSSGEPSHAQTRTAPVEMKRYENPEWKFSLDIPKSWNAFPPVLSNSPHEVVRFESNEGGKHTLLIVFRDPRDPKEPLSELSAKVQQILAGGGFGNFGSGKSTLESNETVTLDFDKAAPDGKTWSCRHYFIADGTLCYTLGFGTEANRSEMTGLYDSMVKSFQTAK